MPEDRFARALLTRKTNLSVSLTDGPSVKQLGHITYFGFGRNSTREGNITKSKGPPDFCLSCLRRCRFTDKIVHPVYDQLRRKILELAKTVGRF